MFRRLLEDEKKPEEKFNTEIVMAFSDGCDGSESERINEAGKDEDLESESEDEDLYPKGATYSDGSRPVDFYQRLHRVYRAESFIHSYKFALGEKICIHPDGEPIFCASEYCFDSTLVGVHGMESLCVVFRRDMDMTRLPPFYQKDSLYHNNMRLFAKAAISEVECLPHKDVVYQYHDDDFRRSCNVTVKKPFAVVSLGLGTLEESGHEDLKRTLDLVPETINYLESVVSSDSLHTHYGIIRAAIKAYQLMCHKELRAEDIWVTIMNVKTGWCDHLPMDIIGEQLELVNGLSSEKDLEKPLFVPRGCLYE